MPKDTLVAALICHAYHMNVDDPVANVVALALKYDEVKPTDKDDPVIDEYIAQARRVMEEIYPVGPDKMMLLMAATGQKSRLLEYIMRKRKS